MRVKSVNSGFSLIELMVAVVIAAIVVSLAIPSYREYVVRANRSEAIEAIMATAGCHERRFTKFNAYAANSCPVTVPSGRYTISTTVQNSGQTYTISAAPQGVQVKDGCGTLTYTNTGVEGSSGGTAADCWAGK